MSPLRLRIDGATFRDPQNREVTLHGINIAGDTKLPAKPDQPSHSKDGFFDGDHVSFVNRPFSIEDAHTHFARLKRWGYNTIRYIFTWECIEHEGPGKYDEEFCQHTVQLLRIAKGYGFYVFMDPHQDVWSRFTGGSGAPMWTVYACGLDPQKFHDTQAALVQNTWPEPSEFPKMIWATNYTRLACQVIFTMFFAGKDFLPKCIIDGVNIQDWLQDHFVAACRHLAQRIHEAGDLHGDVVIGYETVNEPNKGLIGHPDLGEIPKEQNLKKGTTPTAFQAMLSGSGRAIEVPTWEFGGMGPYKSGTELVDPRGMTAWLDPDTWDDTKYGWKRSPDWELGSDVFAQHGIWNPTSDTLLEPNYFSKHPSTGEEVDPEYFINNYFLDYYRKYRHAIRSLWPEAMMFFQPSPFDIPPRIKGTDIDENNLVFASHFYDGITLITKKWNRYWNVDVLGVLRGRYSNPAFALKVGEQAVRNCFRDQLSEIRKEGYEYMGSHPCIYTEIGIPYDMNDKQSYTTGDYFSQSLAIDANHFAVEGSKAQGYTWWVYTASNSHYWGDNWNGEDLSIYCSEDRQLPTSAPAPGELSPAPSSSSLTPRVSPDNLKKTLSVESMSASPSSLSGRTPAEKAGFRAAEAFVRPYPIALHGKLDAYGFDLKQSLFTVSLTTSSQVPDDAPSEMFLPAFHFPAQQTHVEVSSGKWEMRTIEVEGETKGEDAGIQVLKWWYGAGEQKISVRGVKRQRGAGIAGGEAEDEGYLKQYVEMGKQCAVM
ncbi:hypothetical protein LTR95_000558 [Oleoguttula sp. CCFEE 5521]